MFTSETRHSAGIRWESCWDPQAQEWHPCAMLGETCRCNGVARLAVGLNLRCIRLQTSWTGDHWFFTSLYSVSECFRCLRNLGAKYFWRRISGDHSTPKIVQGADNGTLAGALGYAAWQLHDGVWWLFLMVINGNPEMCSSWGSWGLISRGSKQRQSRSHSNELPRRDLQGCWDQLGMGHFTLSCNIL